MAANRLAVIFCWLSPTVASSSHLTAFWGCAELGIVNAKRPCLRDRLFFLVLLRAAGVAQSFDSFALVAL